MIKERKIRKDLSGQKVGKLLVIEPYERRLIGVNKHSVVYYKCLCDCGKEHIANGGSLRSGDIKSCGCGNYVNRMAKGESAFKRLFRNYKKEAIQRGYEFSLSEDVFRKLTKQCCNYCGAIPSKEISGVRSNGSYKYNGIDRVCNELGYIESNVVPCCTICNISKRDLTQAKFIEWITSVYNHSVLKFEVLRSVN